MMRKSRLLLPLLLLAAGLAGCTSVPVRLESAKVPAADLSRGRVLSAQACGFQLLLFIPIATNDRQQRALQSLRAQAGGDPLADFQVAESWFYGLVGTGYCTTLQATAYPRH